MTSPACTELEVQVMNWFGKILDLPKEFLNESEGPGGGVIQVFIKNNKLAIPLSYLFWANENNVASAIQ